MLMTEARRVYSKAYRNHVGRKLGCKVVTMKVQCGFMVLKIEKREPEGRKLKGRKLERELAALRT